MASTGLGLHRRAWLLAALAIAFAIVAPSGSADSSPPTLTRSPILVHGENYTMVFFSPGDIQYHCHIHQSMTGTLHVVPSTGRAPLRQQVLIFDDGNATHTTQMGFAGASGSNRTTLAAGDSVEWENEGSLVHDVAMYLPSSASESGLGAWGMVAAVVAVVAVVAILMARQLRRRPPREG